MIAAVEPLTRSVATGSVTVRATDASTGTSAAFQHCAWNVVF